MTIGDRVLFLLLLLLQHVEHGVHRLLLLVLYGLLLIAAEGSIDGREYLLAVTIGRLLLLGIGVGVRRRR